MQTFRDIGEEALFFRRTQITKYTHVYSISFLMLNPEAAHKVVVKEAILEIMEDADFHITHLTGSCDGPMNADGTRFIISNTETVDPFPSSWPAVGAGTNNVMRFERGIYFRFFDPEVNRDLMLGIPTKNAVDLRAMEALQSDFNYQRLDFNSVFTPGFGYGWGRPVLFDYTLMKKKRLKITIENRSNTPNDGIEYTRVSMAFVGHRYSQPAGNV